MPHNNVNQIILTGGASFVAGPSSSIQLDPKMFHFGVSIICSLSTQGAGSYWVEITGDPPQRPFVNWNTHDIIGGGTYPGTPITNSANSNLAFPVTGIRLNCTTLITNVTLTLSLVQAIGVA